MDLLKVRLSSKTYGSGETAVHALKITYNRGIAQAADRVLNVSDRVLADLGRCRE